MTDAAKRAELTAEFEAMRTIDEALSSLPDDVTRGRVLRWACEKRGVTTPGGGQ